MLKRLLLAALVMGIACQPGPITLLDASIEATLSDVQVAACTGADGSWRCALAKPHTLKAAPQPLVPASWSVATWFLDKQNVSGTASDTNDCATSTTACLHFGEIALHRWGTYAPALQQTTTINTLSGWLAADLADPFNWLGTGGVLQMYATLGAADTVGSGVLAGTVAKNAATNTLLQETLIAGAAAGQMIQNTTHPSIGFVFNSLGGGNFEISQPMSNGGAPNFIVGAENNSWADGDAYTLFNLPGINIGQINASRSIVVFNFQKKVLANSSNTIGAVIIRNSNILGPAGSSSVAFNPTPGTGSTLANVDVSGCNVSQSNLSPIVSQSGVATGFNIVAGDYRNNGSAGAFQGEVAISGDWICGGGATGSCALHGGKVTANALWARIPMRVTEDTLIFSAGATFAGNQTLDIQRAGRVVWNSGNTATATFLQTAGTPFLLNGVSTACSLTAAAVWACGVTVNQANLDAAAGVAGFGGNAIGTFGARLNNAAN